MVDARRARYAGTHLPRIKGTFSACTNKEEGRNVTAPPLPHISLATKINKGCPQPTVSRRQRWLGQTDQATAELLLAPYCVYGPAASSASDPEQRFLLRPKASHARVSVEEAAAGAPSQCAQFCQPSLQYTVRGSAGRVLGRVPVSVDARQVVPRGGWTARQDAAEFAGIGHTLARQLAVPPPMSSKAHSPVPGPAAKQAAPAQRGPDWPPGVRPLSVAVLYTHTQKAARGAQTYRPCSTPTSRGNCGGLEPERQRRLQQTARTPPAAPRLQGCAHRDRRTAPRHARLGGRQRTRLAACLRASRQAACPRVSPGCHHPVGSRVRQGDGRMAWVGRIAGC